MKRLFAENAGSAPQIVNPGQILPSADLWNDMVPFAIQWLLKLTAALAVFFIIVSAFQYFYALGDEEKSKEAKEAVYRAVSGLFLAVTSYAAVDIVMNIFKGGENLSGNEVMPAQPANLNVGALDIIQNILPTATKLMLGVTAAIMFAGFTLSGIFFLTARGEEEKITKAKKIFYFSFLAVILIAVSYAVVAGVAKIFNLG